MSTDRLQVLEIEIDGPHNEGLIFAPLQGKYIRGKQVFERCAEPMAKALSAKWTAAVPGQKLRLEYRDHGPDDIGTLKVIDLLYKSPRILNQVAAEGYTPPPEEESFQLHAATALYFMRQAVMAGIAKVTEGELVQRTKAGPHTNFFVKQSEDRNAKMTDVLSSMAKAIDANTQALLELLKRK